MIAKFPGKLAGKVLIVDGAQLSNLSESANNPSPRSRRPAQLETWKKHGISAVRRGDAVGIYGIDVPARLVRIS
jgi:hypothetical protein